MSAQTIFTRLVNAGMSAVGACAMLGNMQAESALRANNVQDGCGYSDEDYTAAVDAGQLDFIDAVGYGLCQWTYGPRKLKLLNYARSRGSSIGDENMQVDFCILELRSEYPGLWLYLCSAAGIYEAAEKICTGYERPAVDNSGTRAAYANEFYMMLGGMDVSEQGTIAGGASPSPTGGGESYWPPRVLAYGMAGPDVVALQGLLIAHGYAAGISGTFDTAADAQLRAFQRAKGLTVDGIAGPKSWAALTWR